MLDLPRLTEKDLRVFKNKKILLYGYSQQAKEIYEIFKFMGFDVIAFCDETAKVKQYKKIPVFSHLQLCEKQFDCDDIVVQCTFDDANAVVRSEKNFALHDWTFSELSAPDLLLSFQAVSIYRLLKKCTYKKEKIKWYIKKEILAREAYFCFNMRQPENPIFILLPPKTADHTLNATFNFLNSIHIVPSDSRFDFSSAYNKVKSKSRVLALLILPFNKANHYINYVNLMHRNRYFQRKKLEKKYSQIKVITAVREPISQNLSLLYQELGHPNWLTVGIKDWMFGKLEGQSKVERENTRKEVETLFIRNVSGVQQWFDLYVERYIYPQKGEYYSSTHARSIQEFILEFSKYILDITDYPFDKEKGYTIIKDGKLEVFVYQLEKLNRLLPELSEWIGVPFDKLENANQASDKWIADSYKQAQKEIEITQEYFDKCFDEPYVNHCYSEADIEKFKAKWQPHIKK